MESSSNCSNNEIVVHPIPVFDDNYIWVIGDMKTRRAVVVDPGDATPVINWLIKFHMGIEAILITHHHADHIGGIAGLLEFDRQCGQRFPCVYTPAKEKIPHSTHALANGDVLDFKALGVTLNVLEVPGHTIGHIAYFGYVSASEPVLFCGDTLFAGGCGRLLGGTPAQMYQSLHTLAELPSETKVYCAHEYTLANLAFAAAAEPDNDAIAWRTRLEFGKRSQGIPTIPSTIALEKSTNPFVRASDVAEFTRLREWKNNFTI
jgi:hydroxyacylglutathione hydrolase